MLLKLTPASIGEEYKQITFELINNLKMDHHRPDDAVVTQNEPVLDSENDYLDNAYVYFIMTGNYKVQSLMYEMKHKRSAMSKEEENPGNAELGT